MGSTRTPLKLSSRSWTVRMSQLSSEMVRRRKSPCHAEEVVVAPALLLPDQLPPLKSKRRKKRLRKSIWEAFSEMMMTIEHQNQSTLLASKKVNREVEKLWSARI